jgi:hypothetical protein
MKFFNYGDVARVTGTFINSGGTAVDPAVVKFEYKAILLGVATTYTYLSNAELVKAGTGVYYVDLNTSEAGVTNSVGKWTWAFYSTGSGQTSDDGEFYVRPRKTQI